MKTVLTFTPDGTGHCLYTELVDLQQLGVLAMRRASTIEFNDTTQEWEVREPGGALLYHHPSRAKCLAWEQHHYNQ